MHLRSARLKNLGNSHVGNMFHIFKFTCKSRLQWFEALCSWNILALYCKGHFLGLLNATPSLRNFYAWKLSHLFQVIYGDVHR